MRLGTILGTKILKKEVQIGSKLKRGLGTQEGHLALLKCRLAQIFGPARGLPDWDKAYFFRLCRDKDAFQFVSDLILLSILTSINGGNKSELRALLSWLLCSPYVKDVLEAFASRTSIL